MGAGILRRLNLKQTEAGEDAGVGSRSQVGQTCLARDRPWPRSIFSVLAIKVYNLSLHCISHFPNTKIPPAPALLPKKPWPALANGPQSQTSPPPRLTPRNSRPRTLHRSFRAQKPFQPIIQLHLAKGAPIRAYCRKPFCHTSRMIFSITTISSV